MSGFSIGRSAKQVARRRGGTVSLRVLPDAGKAATSAGTDQKSGKRDGKVKPSKAGKRRALVLLLVHVAFGIHVLLWLRFGRTISPVEPSESMQTLSTGVINAGFVFFTLAILSTILFGRFFCGWGCHVVALQDACGWLMKKCGVRPKPFRSRLLLYAPLAFALYMFVWPPFHRLVVTPLVQDAPIEVQAMLGVATPFNGWSSGFITEDFWGTFPSLFVAIPFLFICGFAAVYFLGAKGFCTYGCPYGGFFRPVDRVSPGRIKVDHDKCEGCGHCTAVCTSNVRVHEEVHDFGMVVDPGCMKCLDCVSVCPNDALSFGFARPPVLKGKPGHRERHFARKVAAKRGVDVSSGPIDLGRFEKAARAEAPSPNSLRKSKPRKWDLSWKEEVLLAGVFVFSFLAWRGIYGVVPLLMAGGVAGVVTFLAWMLVRLVREDNLRLHQFQFKLKKKMRPAGWAFGAVAGLIMLLTVQSFLVQASRWRGSYLDTTRVFVPASLVFSEQRHLIPRDQIEHAREALGAYAASASFRDGGIALASTPQTEVRRAWLYSVVGEFEEAERIIRRLRKKGQMTETLAFSALRIFDMERRDEDAKEFLADAVRLLPRNSAVRVEYASRLARAGRVDDALATLREGVTRRPWDADLRASYATLLMQTGDLDGAIEQLREATASREPPPFALRQLGVALLAKGEIDAGASVLDRLMEMRPADPEPATLVARALVGAGRMQEASAYLDKAEAAKRLAVEEQRRMQGSQHGNPARH